MNALAPIAFASILLAASPAWSAEDAAKAPSAGTPVATVTAEMTDGEVRKIDMDNRKITLRHGEIKNLGMPAMSMVFQVKDPAFLDKFKAGDKVRFTAEKLNGALTVTNIEAAK